jgi:serine/threonine protein kinase
MFTNSIACIAQAAILLTFYTALSIDTEVVFDFGLGDLGIGIFLVFINMLVLGLVLILAYIRFTSIRAQLQWRKALTTQELDMVNKLMNDDKEFNEWKYKTSNDNEGESNNNGDDIEIPPITKPRGKSVEERDHATSKMLNQHLLHAKDVVMIKKVGSGAFGEVFKGTCMGEFVAIKTMIDVTEVNVREFKAEIVLTATLRHPNIVNFVGACWGKELMCLVLEWVAKGSLLDLLQTKHLHWEDPLLRLATDIARGMNYLHNRKFYDEREEGTVNCIIHRDLKPDNALVSEFTAAKLADFGTSRAKGEEDVTMTAVGTPLYVAPEIARGENYDEKVDVYSFGLTLMEMCVEEQLLDFIGGRWVIAFDKKKIPKAAMRIIRPMTEDGWRPVTDENPIPFAPPTINSLIVRCCDHDPTKRPSFEIILEELNEKCKEEIDAASFGRRMKENEKEDKIEQCGDEDIIDKTNKDYQGAAEGGNFAELTPSSSLPNSELSLERKLEFTDVSNAKNRLGSML